MHKSEELLKEELNEIDFLHKGIVNMLNRVNTANLSHQVCFVKHFASEIGEECKKIRKKIKNTRMVAS